MSEAVRGLITERCKGHSFRDCDDFEVYHYRLQMLRYKLYPVIGHDNFELVLDSQANTIIVIVHFGEEIDRCIVDLP